MRQSGLYGPALWADIPQVPTSPPHRDSARKVERYRGGHNSRDRNTAHRTGICHVSVLCKLIYFRTARAFLAPSYYHGTLTSSRGNFSFVLRWRHPCHNTTNLNVVDVGQHGIEPQRSGTASPSATYLGSPLVLPNRDPRLSIHLRDANPWYLRSRV